MNKLLVVLLGLCVLAGVYLALVPGPVDAVAYRPPLAPPMTGVLQPNEKLKAAALIGVGQVIGPEDVAVDDQGRIYGGTLDGRILRVDGDRVESFADTGGRPLGLHFDARGNLIVCDAVKGLLSVNVSGDVRVLVTEADGVPFGFTDDLDIASDGRIYFSDASSRYHVHDYLLDCIEARPYGRLLRFDPQTGETEVLLRELYFANGVALSPDEDFVLVNETYRYRVTRFWLTSCDGQPYRNEARRRPDSNPDFLSTRTNRDNKKGSPGRRFLVSNSHFYCPSCKQDMLNAIDAARVIPGNHLPQSIDG
jgi:sugar lactone lactonase YvrE